MSPNSIGFEGQAVIITGGGSGLGECYAREFARRGASVVVNDLPVKSGDSPANSVVAELVSSGARAVASLNDVATASGAEATVADALAAFGRVDAMVSNAGVLADGDLGDLSAEDWRRVVEVNLTAHFLVTSAVWPTMVRQGGGRIVLTSSGSGLFGNRGQINYSSAKAGVMGLARSAALEGADHAIVVNAFAPLAFTPMAKPGVARPSSRVPARAIVGAELFDTFAAQDVAALVLLLAHERCPGTGATFTSAGGRVREVLIAESEGWGRPGTSPEELLDRWDDVREKRGLGWPTSLQDSLLDLVGRL